MIEMNLIYFVLLDSAWSISSWYQHSIALMNSGLCSGQPSCAEPAGGGGGFSSASGRRLKSGDVRITAEMMICDLSWPAYWVYWPPNRSLVLSIPVLSHIRYLKMSLKGIKCSPLSLQDNCTTLLLSLRLQLYLLTLPASSLPKPSPMFNKQHDAKCIGSWNMSGTVASTYWQGTTAAVCVHVQLWSSLPFNSRVTNQTRQAPDLLVSRLGPRFITHHLR